MELVFASGNPHKVKEVNSVLPESIHILSLKDIGFTGDIPETQPTIKGNALQKADYLTDVLGRDGFADDTGLEVLALNGDPGVYSARYSNIYGSSKPTFDENMDLLLTNLKGKKNRRARFITIIALKLNGETHFFEGILSGEITNEKRGSNGFGYDPIFLPHGYDITLAQMDSSLKNKISHRALAVKQLVNFLKTFEKNNLGSS